MSNGNHLTRLNRILVALTVILVILTVILTIATLYYSGESKKYASNSEYYASESEKHLQKVTELSEEIIDWYKNPEPILTNWTNYGKFSYISIETYEKWEEMIEFYYPYEYKPLSEFVTEITFYLWNSGRAPARFLTLDIDFDIEGYDNNNPEYPYPVKIYSITTPDDYLGYIGYSNGEYINATIHGGGIFANSDGRIKFLPEIENETNTIQFPNDVKLGNIKPNDIISFTIKVFAMQNDFKGDMIVYIKDLEDVELQKIYVPLKSFYAN